MARLTTCLLAGLLTCEAALADFRGRQVSEILDELRSEGLTFIYNTQVVPASLRVETEPRARGGVALAEEILAAHGLRLSEAAPHVYAVVAGPRESIVDPAPPAVAEETTVEEVVVQTSRYTLAAGNLATRTFLTQEQVKNMPRLADETLRAVQRLPGTATNGFSSLGPVRGGEPGETAVILDGLRLYEPFHLKNFLSPVSLLDSRVVESIEFYSGGFPAIYGDRMSAIIDADTVRPTQRRYYEAGLNLFHTSLLGSMQFDEGRGNVLLSGRRSNVGDLSQLSEKDYGEPHYSDGFGRIDYRFSDATRASFDALVSSDAIEAIKSSGTQVAHAHYRNVYSWLTVDHDWSDRSSSRVIASFTDLSNERHASVEEPGRRVGSVSDDRLFHVVGLRIENSYEGARLHHRYGAEVRRLWGTYDYASQITVEPGFPFPGSPGMSKQLTLSPEPDGYESSAYWEARAALNERWTLQGGMRVDTQTYDGSDDSEQWSPRLSVLYALGPDTHLRASWGRFFQSQGINELQVEDGVDRFYQAQHADHAIMSLEHSFEPGVDLRIEAYRKYYRRINPRFENLFDPLVLFPEAEFDRVRVAPRSSSAHGVEVSLRLRPQGSWSGWLSYTWSQIEDRIDGHDVPRSWDQTHAVNLGIVWAKGPWTATIANSFHSGWPTTQLQVTSAPGGAPQIVLSNRNRARLDLYNTLDARLTRTFALSRGALDVFVEVNNALSRSNQCCVRYDIRQNPDGSLNLRRDVDSWMPLVPSAGVLWRY